MPDPLESRVLAAGLPRDAANLLETYLDEIFKHQERYGLIKGTHAELIAHLEESLKAVDTLPLDGVEELLDLGSGVGIPGIVLGIVAKYRFPNLRLTLVERRTKRSLFLEGVVARLALNNIRIFADDVKRLAFLADAAVCRAFMPLGGQLIELARSILKPKGWLAYFAGKRNLIDEKDLEGLKTDWYRLDTPEKERWVCVLKFCEPLQ